MRTFIKVIAVLFVVIALITTLSACGNRQMFDTTYTFNRAIVCLANGDIIEGNVSSWTDFGDGNMVQVRINGVTYLVHSSNCTLIAE